MWCMSAEYMITMYDTKTQELRWNATYNDYSAPLYDDKKYEYSRSFTTHAQILQAVYWICECASMLFLDFITFECVCESQRCHTLHPAGTAWWLRWIGTLVRCYGCRSLILQWQRFIYGVRTVCGELLIWRLQQKPCVTWPSLQKTHSPTPWSGPTSSQRRTTALRLS